jgi:hypothetical protein
LTNPQKGIRIFFKVTQYFNTLHSAPDAVMQKCRYSTKGKKSNMALRMPNTKCGNVEKKRKTALLIFLLLYTNHIG